MEFKKVAETSRWWSPRDRGVIQASIEESLFVLLRLSGRAAPPRPLMNGTARAYQIARGIYQREM